MAAYPTPTRFPGGCSWYHGMQEGLPLLLELNQPSPA